MPRRELHFTLSAQRADCNCEEKLHLRKAQQKLRAPGARPTKQSHRKPIQSADSKINHRHSANEQIMIALTRHSDACTFNFKLIICLLMLTELSAAKWPLMGRPVVRHLVDCVSPVDRLERVLAWPESTPPASRQQPNSAIHQLNLQASLFVVI